MKAFFLFRLIDIAMFAAYVMLWCWLWMGKLFRKPQRQNDPPT